METLDHKWNDVRERWTRMTAGEKLITYQQALALGYAERKLLLSLQ